MTDIVVRLKDVLGRKPDGVVSVWSVNERTSTGVTTVPARASTRVRNGEKTITGVKPGLARIDLKVAEFQGTWIVEVPDQGSVDLAELIT